MSLMRSSRTMVFFSVWCALALSAPSIVVAAADRPATPEEQALLRSMGINSTIINDETEKLLKGGCPDNPYPYLEARHRGDRSNSFITPRAGSVSNSQWGLNPILACRLKKFMEFAESKGCPITINSAMRPVQRCNPSGGACAPQGASCHQYGLAVDVGASAQCLNWILATLGRKNASSPFGIHSAYAEHPGYRHLQCVENLQAACSPQTKGCGGDMTFNPGDLSNLPGPGQMPSSGITNPIRQALGMQPQQPPSVPSYTPSAQTSMPSTANLPQPTQSQFCLPEYRCNGNTLVYQNSFCATQMQQVCSAGCSNGKCIAPMSTSTATSTGSGSDTENTNENRGSTIIDILSRLGSSTATSTTVGTSTPLQLLLSITGGQFATTASTTQAAATGTRLISMQLVGAQQTFVSPDLNPSVNVGRQTQQTQTGFYAMLENMKRILLWILDYLRPFQVSRNRAEGGDAHSYGE